MSMKTQLESIKTAFDNAKIPYAYNMFPTDEGAPAMPYVTAYVSSGQGMMADDQNYYDTMTIHALLFTATKDPAAEDDVRDILKTLECPYTWTENYAPDERMYVIDYEITMEA